MGDPGDTLGGYPGGSWVIPWVIGPGDRGGPPRRISRGPRGVPGIPGDSYACSAVRGYLVKGFGSTARLLRAPGQDRMKHGDKTE